MTRARYAALASLVWLVVGCDWLWPLDHPHDQRRCEPACADEMVCLDGTCQPRQVGGDASPRDGAAPDMLVKEDKAELDKPKLDKPKLDKPKLDKPKPCGPANCKGCCQAGACLTMVSNAACGQGGQPCVACKKHENCQTGACKLDKSSQWGVTVVNAVINGGKKWDNPPQIAPDPFVEITVATKKGKTSVKLNTLQPTWNEQVLVATANDLLIHGLNVKVFDDDLTGDQLMGSCKAAVAESVLLGGAGMITCGPDVKSIALKFNPK